MQYMLYNMRRRYNGWIRLTPQARPMPGVVKGSPLSMQSARNLPVIWC